MAKKSYILPFFGLALAGAGIVAWKRGMFANLMHQQVQNAQAEMRLELMGFHGEPDGTVMASIRASNVSSIPMQVQSVLGDIWVGNAKAGTVNMFGDIVVRPNDQATIPVAVRVMPAAAALLRKKGEAVNFRGQININNHVAPLTMNYRL